MGWLISFFYGLMTLAMFAVWYIYESYRYGEIKCYVIMMFFSILWPIIIPLLIICTILEIISDKLDILAKKIHKLKGD